MLCLVGNAGTLVTYIIGVFVNWRQLAFISLIISIPYVIGLVIYLPNDFPHRKQKSNINEQKSELKDVFKCKQMYLGIGITFFYQFAGYNIVTNYAGCGSILQNEGRIQIFGLNSGLINATFVGLAGLIGVIIGTILVYWNFERQYNLLFSNLGIFGTWNVPNFLQYILHIRIGYRSYVWCYTAWYSIWDMVA